MSQEALLQKVDPTDLSTVQDWLDAAVPELRNRLVKRCGDDVPVHVDPGTSTRLSEVLQRTSVVACPFRAEPSGLRGLVLVESALVRTAVGRFLGDRSPHPEEERPLTRIDLRMGQHLCNDVLASLHSACAMDDAPSLAPGRIAANPRTVQELPQARNVIDVSCTIGSPEEPLGRVWVVLPPQGAGVLWPNRGPTRNVRTHPAVGLRRVMPVPLPVVAELARQTVPLSKLQQLSVGDVLTLGSMSEVTVRVGDRPALHAEPGEADGMRSVRVKGRVAT